MTSAATSASLRGQLRRGVPLAPYTSWRVGGPADQLYEPADREDLLAFLAQLPPGMSLWWMGLGTNTLVRDGGFRGAVIVLRRHLTTLRLEAPSQIYAEAGVACARVAKFAERHDLGALGFMTGIPGTIGGALTMNAGAYGSETWAHVAAAEAAFAGGTTRWLMPRDFVIAYRSVQMPAGFLGFLAARLEVQAQPAGGREQTQQWMARRRATQPLGHPSGGSTFRNPPGGHAAQLIEAAGLKGHRIGGASVSTLHANFLLNDGTATAADIEALIEYVRAAVEAASGVRLELEVRIVGEPAAQGAAGEDRA